MNGLFGIPFEQWKTFQFGEPIWLWSLPFLFLLWFTFSGNTKPTALRFSTITLLNPGERSKRHGVGRLRVPFRFFTLMILMLALAQPRLEQGTDFEENEGIDIVLVLDYSKSMDAEDFYIDGEAISRLAALNKVIDDFIENRERDRIGVVGFAADPYLVSPLTSDHDFVTEIMGEVRTMGGTAIGSGMVAAVEMLKDSETVSKVLIVVTDGLSNTGVPPMEAAKYAEEKGIRIYPIEILDYRKLNPDRVLAHPLNQIAKLTGGQFYQAADYASLENIYNQIDDLETSLIKERVFKVYTELFYHFLILGVSMLMLEILGSIFFGRSLP